LPLVVTKIKAGEGALGPDLSLIASVWNFFMPTNCTPSSPSSIIIIFIIISHPMLQHFGIPIEIFNSRLGRVLLHNIGALRLCMSFCPSVVPPELPFPSFRQCFARILMDPGWSLIHRSRDSIGLLLSLLLCSFLFIVVLKTSLHSIASLVFRYLV
jgi:hypothetical protein